MDRVDEARAALRRDAYTRFLIASDRVADFLIMQPPTDTHDNAIDPALAAEKAQERFRKLWTGGDEHIVEYTTALMQGRLLASPEVAAALEEFDDWMEKQFAVITTAQNPLSSGAFLKKDEKREPLIKAMRLEQERDLLVNEANPQLGSS